MLRQRETTVIFSHSALLSLAERGWHHRPRGRTCSTAGTELLHAQTKGAPGTALQHVQTHQVRDGQADGCWGRDIPTTQPWGSGAPWPEGHPGAAQGTCCCWAPRHKGKNTCRSNTSKQTRHWSLDSPGAKISWHFLLENKCAQSSSMFWVRPQFSGHTHNFLGTLVFQTPLLEALTAAVIQTTIKLQ